MALSRTGVKGREGDKGLSGSRKGTPKGPRTEHEENPRRLYYFIEELLSVED